MAEISTQLFEEIEACRKALIDAKGIEKAKRFAEMGDLYLTMDKAQKAVVFYRSAFDGGLAETSFIDKFSRALVKDGKHDEARRILDKASVEETDPEAKARLHLAYAFMESWLGHYDETGPLCESALNILALRDQQDPKVKRLEAEAHELIGRIFWRKSRFTEALKSLEKALEMFKELDDRAGISDTYNSLGNVYYHKGNLGKALECYELSQKAKERASYYNNAGLIHLARGEFDEAEELFKTSLKKNFTLGMSDLPRVQFNLVDLYIMRMNPVMAKTWLEMAEKSMEELNSKRLAVEVPIMRGRIALLDGDLQMAASLAEEGAIKARQEKKVSVEMWALRLQGIVAAARGDHLTARSLFQRAIDRFRKIEMNYELACTLVEMAKVQSALEDKAEAQKCAAEAKKFFKTMSLDHELEKMKKLGF